MRMRAASKATGSLAVGLIAAALLGCGSSGPTPVQVGQQWYRATAIGDGNKVCKLSTALRQQRFIELAEHLPGGASGAGTCPAAVELTLKHFGGIARLGKFAHVHIRLLSQSKTTAEVQAENAAPLELVRSGSTWLVSGAAPRT
jgi:hypothetical protein